jgi:cephalosporin hydroxylase
MANSDHLLYSQVFIANAQAILDSSDHSNTISDEKHLIKATMSVGKYLACIDENIHDQRP